MRSHALLLKRFARSFFNSDFWSFGGWTRSFVVKNVMMRQIRARAPRHPIAHGQPTASFPFPKYLTSQIVEPWTTSPPANAATKRNDEISVRSSEFGVITPMSAEYGTLTIV